MTSLSNSKVEGLSDRLARFGVCAPSGEGREICGPETAHGSWRGNTGSGLENRSEQSGGDQRRTEFDAAFHVHLQQPGRSPADSGQAHDLSILKLEVVRPVVGARVEQIHDLARLGILTAQIRSLMKIAPVTSKRQAGRPIVVNMLLSDDVLDVKRTVNGVLGQLAVFATVG